MSYSFRWEHPADEVFVTGTFDNWGRSTKLDKHGSFHLKTVALPVSAEKTLYKFIVDGQWKHDHTARTETDSEGNLNNVLSLSDIIPESQPQPQPSSVASAAAAPSSSTPSVPSTMADLPGTFPVTPANELQNFLSPLPPSEGAGNPVKLSPGEPIPHPSTINENTLSSHVHDDDQLKANASRHEESARDQEPQAEESEQAYGVTPLPASGGIGNPIHLQPGESVPEPSSFTSNTIGSNVHLDKESYERSDAGPPVLPAPLSPQSEREARGASMFDLGPQTTNMIPESSLPMGSDMPSFRDTQDAGPFTSSVAPQSTTNELAGQQPLEPRGPPPVVVESQQEASVDPEASANPSALQEKNKMETELHNKISEVPPTSESTLSAGRDMPSVHDTQNASPFSSSVAPQSTTNELAGQQPLESRGPPSVVLESQQEASVDPEASANPSALQEKDEMESELHSKIPEAPPTSESTGGPSDETSKPTDAAAGGVMGTANAMRDQAAASLPSEAPASLPEPVKESYNKGDVAGMATGAIAAAGIAAAGTAFAMRDKVADSTGKDPVSYLPKSVQDSINNMNQNLGHSEPTGQSSKEPLTHDAVSREASTRAPLLSSISDMNLPQQTALGEAVQVPSETGNTLEKIHSGQALETTNSVPDEVMASQKAAHVDPEATANSSAVQAKSAVENELMGKVPEAEAVDEVTGDSASNQVPQEVIASQKAAHVDPEASASPTAVQEKSQLENELLSKIPASQGVGEAAPAVADNYVPQEVVASQREAHVDPEASANSRAVHEKNEVENELMSKVPTSEATGAPAPAISAALTSTAPSSSTEQSATRTHMPDPVGGLALLGSNDLPGSKELNAPAGAPAIPPTSKPAQLAPQTPADSRDVSPMSRPVHQTEPVVTTGVESAKAPAQSQSATAGAPVGTPRRPGGGENSTPQKRQSFVDRMKGTPDSVRSSGSGVAGDGKPEGKEKRKSFFGRIKDKLR